MNLFYFLKGLVIGFFVVVFVGFIGILCINCMLFKGRLYGFVFGLGVVIVDVFYGCIVVFGLMFIIIFLLI